MKVGVFPQHSFGFLPISAHSLRSLVWCVSFRAYATKGIKGHATVIYNPHSGI